MALNLESPSSKLRTDPFHSQSGDDSCKRDQEETSCRSSHRTYPQLHTGPAPSPGSPTPSLSQAAPEVAALQFHFCMKVRESRSVYPSRKCYFIELTPCKLLPQCFIETKSLVSGHVLRQCSEASRLSLRLKSNKENPFFFFFLENGGSW